MNKTYEVKCQGSRFSKQLEYLKYRADSRTWNGDCKSWTVEMHPMFAEHLTGLGAVVTEMAVA